MSFQAVGLSMSSGTEPAVNGDINGNDKHRAMTQSSVLLLPLRSQA